MTYYVDWAVTPTNYNATQRTVVNDLSGLMLSGRGLEWSTHKTVELGVRGHVIFKIYKDTDAEREVFYEHRGYSAPYMSPSIASLIRPALVEVYK